MLTALIPHGGNFLASPGGWSDRFCTSGQFRGRDEKANNTDRNSCMDHASESRFRGAKEASKRGDMGQLCAVSVVRAFAG
jgi:hypothetical protein